MALPNAGEYHGQRNSNVLTQNTQQDSGTEIAGQVYWPGGGSMFSGVGAPGAKVNGKPPLAGDLYLRIDTPSTANQRLYVCTVGGATPTWVGIV